MLFFFLSERNKTEVIIKSVNASKTTLDKISVSLKAHTKCRKNSHNDALQRVKLNVLSWLREWETLSQCFCFPSEKGYILKAPYS